MTKREADSLLRESFKVMAEKAQQASNDEDLLRFTNEAHKIYISLTTYGGWSEEQDYDAEEMPS